ncbi:hypothetical protein TNCV_2928901 [Trichonephila clavipes]|nr:hypothetical protein TNCV_2928901 [Trichonephila clavipes]
MWSSGKSLRKFRCNIRPNTFQRELSDSSLDIITSGQSIKIVEQKLKHYIYLLIIRSPAAHVRSFRNEVKKYGPIMFFHNGAFLTTATAGSDVVQSGRPIFDDFFQHLWPYIGNNTANVVFQMVKRLWLIRKDQ